MRLLRGSRAVLPYHRPYPPQHWRPITVKKVVEDGDSTSGLQNKDTQKIDIDSSVTTVIVRVGSTENVRINCPAVNAAFIVCAVNAHKDLLALSKELLSRLSVNHDLGYYEHVKDVITKAEAQ